MSNLINECGAPGATGIGFTEALTLLAQGKAAMWVDATVAAGFLKDPKQSTIVDQVGFAMAPQGPATEAKGYHWLWAWSLAVPETSPHKAEALQFITWATSKDYVKLVGETNGWATIPPGTRKSTYACRQSTRAAAGDFCAAYPEVHRNGRPDCVLQGSSAVRGRAVCRHSRIPGSRH